MEKTIFTTFLVIFALLVGSITTSCDGLFGSDDDSTKTTQIPFRTITLGASGAWDGIDPVVVDPENDNEIPGVGNDIVAVYVAYDDDFLFWRIDVAGNSPGDNHGYGIAAGYPDHYQENAIEARVTTTTGAGPSAWYWLRDADGEWQRQPDLPDDHCSVGTYIEMKLPLDLINFDPFILFGYVRDNTVNDSADQTDDSPALTF